MSKSTQDLINQANANLPDNNTGEISAQDVREQHVDVAQSSFNKITDKHLVGLKSHNVSTEYKIGDSVIQGGYIWECTADNTGAFDSADWQQLGTSGSPYQLLIDSLNANGLSVSGTNPQTLSLIIATASNAGALSSADWQTFNGKQNALGFTPIDVAEKGANNGTATLDSTGKLSGSQLPDSITGALSYMGQWNPSTNTPTISDAGGSQGQYYVANADGTIDLGSGSIQMFKGDWVIHDGSKFEKLDNTLGAKWGQVIGNINNQTDLMTELAKYLTDAPSDGKQYARRDGGWAEVVGGGGGGSYSFGNGINENGGVVKLGGSLTESTVIQGDSNTHAIQLVDLSMFVVDTQWDTLQVFGGLTYSYDDGAGSTNTTTINPGGISVASSSNSGQDTVSMNLNPGGITLATQNGASNQAEVIANENQIRVGGTNTKWLHMNSGGVVINGATGNPTAAAALDVNGNMRIQDVTEDTDGDGKFMYQSPSGVVKKSGLPAASDTVAGTLYFKDDPTTSTLTISTSPIV